MWSKAILLPSNGKLLWALSLQHCSSLFHLDPNKELELQYLSKMMQYQQMRVPLSHTRKSAAWWHDCSKNKISAFMNFVNIYGQFPIPQLPRAHCLAKNLWTVVAINRVISFSPIKFKVIALFHMMKTEAQQLMIYKLSSCSLDILCPCLPY